MSWEVHLDMTWAPSSSAGPSSAAPTPKLTSLLFSRLPSFCPLLAWRDTAAHIRLTASLLSQASFSDANMCSVPYSRNTGQRSPTAGSVLGRALWWWSLWDLDDLRDRTHSQSSRVKQLPLNTNCREICEHHLHMELLESLFTFTDWMLTVFHRFICVLCKDVFFLPVWSAVLVLLRLLLWSLSGPEPLTTNPFKPLWE